MGTNPTQQDYVMDVLLRNYCRTAEENDILYEEMEDLRNTLKALFQENADIRFRLVQAGIEVPPSEFVIVGLEEMDEADMEEV